MKTIFSIICTFVLSTFLVTVAFATDNCSGDTCMDNPSPPTIPELTTSNFGISIEALGGTAGIGEVVWSGADGIGAVEKISELKLLSTLEYAGENCEFNCGDSQLTFSGLASELVRTQGIAAGQSPDGAVSVANGSLANTFLEFGVTISETPAPAPGNDDNGG